ncbi:MULTISPECIES: Crp/Fnr family transcriptional regulator [unclassified Enterococcus]|uniref:Crp/Fnr family transcriptional regulator n=1 Tax=unclassified Enterococcus TaxID=2608891 RepID=UPI0013EC83E4|nr:MULTISPECIES: Crp/Fnr family transcriptional regulator [unclassified Enterococcus]
MRHEGLCVSLVPLFNHLEIEDQQKIHSLVTHRKVEKGEQIFAPDGDAQLVIVARGSLKVYQLSTNGKEQLLRVVEPGGYEGESQLFGVPNETLFGEALEKTEVCVLKQTDFSELLLQYPAISVKLLEINAGKMATIQQQTQFLMMERVEERLAVYLLDLAKATGSSQVSIPMKMKELAAFMGTTPETISRKLKLLESKGFIKREKRNILIIEEEQLEEI